MKSHHLLLLPTLLLASASPSSGQPTRGGPTVIAHRGASGYLPEHTLEAYSLAHGQGAHFIEPDLVLTKDGVFICLHDVQLDSTTNVSDAFPKRARADGHWYAADFTLAEIKQMRAVERLEGRFPKGKSSFEIPTFEEMIELVQGLNQSTGRNVGIYPELKSPTWHRQAALPMEESFLGLVRARGYRGEQAKIFVQCFESGSLERLRKIGSKLPQVMLLGGSALHAKYLTDTGLQDIKRYANGIGPSKTLIEEDPSLVKRAHRQGLLVHPYTFRADDLPDAYKTLEQELDRFFGELGVDGLFTDFPDRVTAWLRANR